MAMPSPIEILLVVIFAALPCYLPLIFIAFAVGRKQITIRQTMIFTALEGIALWLALSIERLLEYVHRVC
jgi:hypothetical protein